MRRSGRVRSSRLAFRGRGGNFSQLRALPDRHFGFGILNVLHHAIHEILERVRALHTQKSSTVAIRVDIGDGVLFQIRGVRLGPFGRTEQAGFLAVPETIDDGPLRLPALFQQFRKAAHLFHLGDRAGDWILRAIHPGVVMIAANDPFVRILGAGNAHDHVIEALRIPVEFHAHVNFRGTRSDVIGDRQRAPPCFGRDRPFQCGQQRLRVSIGHRQHGNFRQRFRFADGQALGVRGRADAGRERIAGIERHVHHAAALRAVARAVRALGKNVVLRNSRRREGRNKQCRPARHARPRPSA